MHTPSFINGIKHSIPIALGYFVVAFTFGMMATIGGLSPFEAILISATNVTSAGQFAGTNIIIAGGTYVELLLSMLIINSRYALMSASLSQKLTHHMSLWKKALLSFCITDETFSVASVEVETVTFRYFLGLIILPYLGWLGGTVVGSFMDNVMSIPMQNAASIALYCMFIALFVPPAKDWHPVRFIVFVTIMLSTLFYYLPLFSFMSNGYKIIVSAIISSIIGAFLYPVEEEVTSS